MKKTIFRIEISLLVALIICGVLNINAFSQQCESIREKMLRMHVIANSDSEEDQQLKLKVRDAVLSAGKEVFDGSVTAIEAKEKITPYIDYLENIALETIKNEGFDYNVKITVEREYFNTRTYENSVTLPAGYYTAVKVIIGEGKGQNWWCVMFPPMCLPTAVAECEISDVLTDDETEIVTETDKYKFRFKIVEILEEIFN
ncbi:MAG: stage II sporulation protein R [Ruminococcaceae bacterium]|nr:stage II sporulation protein R [Oscillospiraceae bacterium]